MIWWQLLILEMCPAVVVLLAVFVGGWMVFKTKTITMPTPFLQMPKFGKKPSKPHSYVDGLFEENEPVSPLDEDLSPAAARLREQKLEAPPNPGSIRESIMKKVRGIKS